MKNFVASEYVPLSDTVYDNAVCKDRPELFFSPKGERPPARSRREDAARTICNSCPVVDQCLELSLINNDHGFWGGKSEDERIAQYGISLVGNAALSAPRQRQIEELQQGFK